MRANQINQLPNTAATTSQIGNSCTVCMENYDADAMLRTLPCFHNFHTDCVDPWLLRKAECPVCRASTLPE